MIDLALLILRLVTGGLLVGHGAQKLFGWFGGYGFEGTAGWLESLGLKPGKPWAALAGLGELVGGLLLVLGFLNPLGPIAVVAVMLTAWSRAHWGKPIWVTSGGAELPLTNIAVALAIAAGGPGVYSLDAALGVQVPAIIIFVVAGFALIGVIVAGVWNPRMAGRLTEERQDRAA